MKNNLKPFYQNFLQRLGSCIPPSDCLLCGLSVSPQQNSALIICEHCHQRLPKLQHSCSVCALPLNHSHADVCGQCLKQTPPMTRTIAAFHYEAPISDFLTGLKFNHQYQVLPLLSEYLIQSIKTAYTEQQMPAAIIPVPLHTKKLRQRGFNQAHLIAQQLARHFELPINSRAVTRVRNTSSQMNLDALQRQRNLKDAFSTVSQLPKHVVIVDDVMTTATTVSELAWCLLKSGVSRIDVWCVARAFSI